jgi:hypothetical protein
MRLGDFGTLRPLAGARPPEYEEDGGRLCGEQRREHLDAEPEKLDLPSAHGQPIGKVDRQSRGHVQCDILGPIQR